jgi:hypothetical protein
VWFEDITAAGEFDSALTELRWVCTWHLDFLPETNTVASDPVFDTGDVP